MMVSGRDVDEPLGSVHETGEDVWGESVDGGDGGDLGGGVGVAWLRFLVQPGVVDDAVYRSGGSGSFCLCRG